MNHIKLLQITEVSLEKIFGIPTCNENTATDAANYSGSVSSFDEDSISDMKSNLEDASYNFSNLESDVEGMWNTLDDWRNLAVDLWEQLPRDIQKEYLAKGILPKEKQERLKNSFNLENLKDL